RSSTPLPLKRARGLARRKTPALRLTISRASATFVSRPGEDSLPICAVQECNCRAQPVDLSIEARLKSSSWRDDCLQSAIDPFLRWSPLFHPASELCPTRV